MQLLLLWQYVLPDDLLRFLLARLQLFVPVSLFALTWNYFKYVTCPDTDQRVVHVGLENRKS